MSGPFGAGSLQLLDYGDFYPHKINQSLYHNPISVGSTSNDPSITKNNFSSAPNGNGQIFTFSCWLKRGGNYNSTIFEAEKNTSGHYFAIEAVQITNKILVKSYDSSDVEKLSVETINDALSDGSGWTHLVVKFNSTSGSEEIKIYLNGISQDLTTTTAMTAHTSAMFGQSSGSDSFNHRLGGKNGLTVNKWGGYFAEVYAIDGLALDADSFGETKADVWIPKKYQGTFPGNSFHLAFGDSSNLGDDTSGNGHDFTISNIPSHVVMPDSPSNNFCTVDRFTLNTGGTSAGILTYGDLYWKGNSAGDSAFGTMGVSSGKWYYEILLIDDTNTLSALAAGWSTTDILADDNTSTLVFNNSVGIRYGNATYNFAASVTTGLTFAVDDIIGFALDLDAGTLKVYQNNVLRSTITLPTDKGNTWIPAFGDSSTSDGKVLANFGQDSSFAGINTRQTNADANGIGNFYYSVPSDHLALCSKNLPAGEFDLAKGIIPSDYFVPVLYTGNGSTQSIDIGFKPDWVWCKKRLPYGDSDSQSHHLFDVCRGAAKELKIDGDAAEVTNADTLTSFDTFGFSIGDDTEINTNTDEYVSWNWKMGGDAVLNTDGSQNSNVSANTRAGQSVMTFDQPTYDATGASYGHGLSSKPEVVMVKNRDTATKPWGMYHKDLFHTSAASAEEVYLKPSTGSTAIDTVFQGWDIENTTINFHDSLFSLPSPNGNMVAYVFHGVEGYSKFGIYKPRNSNMLVNTGFRPAMVWLKRINGSGNWTIYTRNVKQYTGNLVDARLLIDFNSGQYGEANGSSDYRVQFVTNGFYIDEQTGGYDSNSSYEYIYLAWAHQPQKYANAN